SGNRLGILPVSPFQIGHIVDDAARTALAECGNDAGADPSGTAGNQRNLAGKIVGGHVATLQESDIGEKKDYVVRSHRPATDMPTPIRILTAVPICDGHDSAINTINLELIRHSVEVIYLGYHRTARDIVRAAIQEGVRAIGISSYNGGHVEFFGE